MALGSPHLGATPPTVYLEAVVEDPMFLLAKCKARTYTMSPVSYTHLTLPTNREV